MPDCPSLELLEQFVGGDSVAPEIARHVTSCAECRSVTESVRRNNALLDELAGAGRSRGMVSAPAVEFPGYTILSEIHRGGQGIVYRAVQQRTKRVVALKVLIEGSFASPAKRTRFEREAELAAQLKHPHIVTLYDRGVTDDGRPFLAMEFVQGVTLSATPSPLPATRVARLQLFVKICRAVAHAHQRGVIHRDLKPANIIIDASGEPRILDFGLARTASTVTHGDGTPLTVAGEFAGTIAYASPEQLERDPQLVDTRSDVYALGVILHEVLTGRHPRRLDVPVADVIRAITTVDPAPPGIDRDLDTIVLKSLARDHDARYQSASELARDVERYLAGEPIDARRPSAIYLLSRVLARHKLLLAAMVLVTVSLLGATGVSLAYWRRSRRDADLARAEAQRADAVNDFLQDLLAASNPRRSRGRAVSVRDVLDEAALRLANDLDQVPAIASALRATIGKCYQSLGLFAQATPQLTAALAMRRRELGSRHPLVARSLRELGNVLLESGKLAEAEAAFGEAITILRAGDASRADLARTLTDAAGVPDARGDIDQATAMVEEALALLHAASVNGTRLCASLQRLGDLLADRDDHAHAEQRYLEALQLWEREASHAQLGHALCLRGLAASANELGHFDEALVRWQRATELMRKLMGNDALIVIESEVQCALAETDARGEHLAAALVTPLAGRVDLLLKSDHPLASRCLNSLGRLAMRASDHELAIRCFTAALDKHRALNPESDAGLPTILANLGVAASETGGVDQGDEHCREAVALARASSTARGELGYALHALAQVLKKHGKLAASTAAAREALDERSARLGSEHLHVASLQNLLGRLLYARGAADEAEPLLRAALATRRKRLIAPHPLLAQSENALAELLREQKHLAEAETLQRSALEMRRELHGAQSIEVAESLTNLAKVLHDRADPGARGLYEEAVRIASALRGQASAAIMCMNNLVAWLVDHRELDEAMTLARKAHDRSRAELPRDHMMGAFAARNLGHLCELEQQFDEAKTLFRESYETFAQVRGKRHADCLWLLKHLVAVCRKLGDASEADRYQQLLNEAAG